MCNSFKETLKQPLVFVDIDEVVLEHLPHLIKSLARRGYDVRNPIHELDGEVIEVSSGRFLSPDETKELTDQCFADFALRQVEIPGAASALKSLSTFCEIRFLTNFPKPYSELRTQRLEQMNLEFPTIFNTGGKGKFLFSAKNERSSPVIFIDDSISQILNVKKYSPDIFCIHFAYMEHVARKYLDYRPAEVQVRSWGDLLMTMQLNFFEPK